MASKRIKGITIQLGLDATDLNKKLKDIDSSLKDTQTQLKDVNKLLKLDPSNTELLRQKQELLGKAVNDSKTRLDELKKALQQLENAPNSQETIDQQNAQNDQTACQTIAEKLVNDGNDLILAIATPAAQAVAGVTSDIPVVGTAITDFAASGLVNSNDAPGGNVTGSSDLTPVEAQISLLKKVCPDAKTIGILFCSAESNSDIQVSMAKEACNAAGLAYEEFAVASSNEIQSVVESAVGKVDALYCPTDNTIAAGMATVAMVANDNMLPVVAGEEGMVTAGGLCTYSIDYYELGYLAGQMAVRILTEGADPAEMPIEYYPEEKCTFIGNEDTAATLGIDISGLE